MANNGKSYSVQKELDKKYGVKSSSGRASGNTSVQDTLDQKYSYENSSQRRAYVQDWSRRYNEAARAYGETGGTLTDESGEFRNRVNALIQDYGKIKGYSGRMGLPNGQDYIRALRGMVDATGKNRQRAATASGLIPEDANALAGQKQKYERMLFELQKQRDTFLKDNPQTVASGAFAETQEITPMGNYGAIAGQDTVGYGTQPTAQQKQLDALMQSIRETQGTIGDINSQLTIYNRIDKFGDDVTAKYAGGNSMEAREAWRTGKDAREQTFREKEQALRQDSTPYAARGSGVSGNAYAAALSNPQSADFTERLNDYKSEKNRQIIDRLDEYLTWFDGLSEESQRRIRSSDVNGQNPYRDSEIAQNDPGNQNKHWGQMTEDERNAVFRIANTEGTDAAAKYLDDLQMTLDRRQTLAMEQNEKDRAEKTPLIGDMLRGAATVGANLVGAPISFIGNARDAINGKGFNPYSNANFLLNQSGAVREASSQEVYRAIAGDGSNKKLDFLGTLASNAYQAGLSTLDSLAGMATMGKFYTISMGMGAASQRMRELVESGASDREIYVGAIGSGILEALFEKVSLDTFADQWIKANPEKFIRKALIQAGVEGSEEVFTEISNQILDAVNRGVNSDHNVRVRALMKENPGMSETEAEQQAASEDAQEVFWAGFGGALSGGLSSFGGLAIEGHKARQGGTEILSRGQAGEVLQNALELRPNDKAAQNLQAKLSDNTLGQKGRDLSGLYRVAQQNAADMTHADVEAVRAGLEKRFTEMGVPNNGKATAEAIIKQITGEKLSLTDRLALAKNRDAVATVRNEIVSAAAFPTAENKWARDIKTFQLGRLAKGVKMFGTAETQTQKSARETMEKALNQVMGSNSAIVSAMYDEGQSRSDFTTEAAEIYRAGQDGRGLDGVSLSTIGADDAGIIYDMGVRSAEGVGTYDYIEEGQAYRKSDSTPVNVTGFAGMGANPTVSIGNGETVKASDITFGSFGESRLYNTIAKMGVDTQTANDMLKAAESANINASTYSVALNNAYMQGLSGIAFGNIREGSEAMRLDADTRKAAWSAGRAQAEQSDRAKQSVTDKGKHGRKAGGLTVEDSAKDVKLNKQQEAGMNAARVLAGMGLNVSVFASTEADRKDDIYNGIFRSADGTIRVDLNAGKDGQGVMGYALSHEFTHFVEELSAEKFRKFTDILFDVLGKNDVDVNRLIEAKEAVLRNTEEYKNRSEKELRAIAYSEVVAEMMEPVLTDTDAISRISQKIKQQDRSLWGKIKDFIKGIVEKLKAAYRDMEPDSAIARLTRQTVTNSEAVLDAFSEAAADAVLNYNLQEGQKNNAREGERFSIRKTQKMSWDEQIMGALYGKGSIARNDTLVAGQISTSLAQEGIEQLPLAIPRSVLTKASDGRDISHSIKKGKLAKLNVGIKNSPITIVNPARNAIVFITDIKQGGAPVLVAFDRNTFFDGDKVHKATSIHLQMNVQAMLENLPASATVYVKNRNELAAVGATDNLRGLAANVKLISDGIVAQPDADVKGILKSSRGTSEMTYAEILAEQNALRARQKQVKAKKNEAMNNPELLSAMDSYAEMFSELRNLLRKKRRGEASDADIERISEIKNSREKTLKKITKIQDDLGLNGISEEEAELRSMAATLRKAADSAWAREGAQKENKAIEKSGLSAPEYFRRKALRAFKTTRNFNEAGYLLPDGKMLDFSGGERNHRYRDHREIGEIYEATQGANALNRFLNDGNIRIMAESPGVDISANGEPTAEQYAAIRKFVMSHGTDKGKFFVDFSNSDGRNVGNYSYNGNVSPERVLNDIKYFYENGETRKQSEVAEFLYSSRTASDSEYLNLAQNPEENELELKDMVRDAAEKAGFVYRRNARRYHSPQNDVGWQMFVYGIDNDQPKAFGSYEFVATDEGAIPIEDVMPKLRELTEEFYGEPISDDEINPPDIITSAGIFDDVEFMEFLYENYLNDLADENGGEYPAFITADGLMVFTRDDKRVKSLAAVEYDDNGDVIPLSLRFDMGKEDIRYSLRGVNKNGIEVYETSDEVKSLTYAQRIERFLSVMENDYKGRTAKFERNGHAYYALFEQTDLNKNIYGDKRSDKKGWKAKINAGAEGNIFELVENARYNGSKAEQGKNSTAHRGVGYWDYFVKNVQIDNTVFDLVANVRKKADGEYVYSIQLKENKTKEASPPLDSQRALNGVTNASTQRVAQSGTDVKGENLESRRVSQEIKDAIEEYRRQQDVQSKAYRQMYERQLEEVKKSYQKQISTMESEYSANLSQIQDVFFQTVEAYEKGQFRNEHLEKALKQTMEAQRAQAEASKADNATWEKEFNRLLKAYEASGRNAQRLKQTVETQRARAKAKAEAARVTEQRGKLYRAVNEINRRLLNPTKTLYVPDSLAPAVTKFMQGLTEAMESPKNSWNVQGALETLQGQYQKLTQMNEGVFTQEYNQGILDLLDNAINAVGGTDFNKLSASQIEDVYSAVRSVLTAIRNENKMFAANLNKTYAEAAAAVRREEAALPNRKPTTGAVQDKAEKFGWNQLKPVYAMMRLGSDTLLKQYNNLRAGEDKWQRVIAAARAYGLGTMAKYNYDQWDDSLMKLDTETRTVELSLQERMSLYAYARREQAFEHLTKGGFVLSDKNTRTVKNRFGIETEQKVQDYNAYVLTAEQVAGIRGAENILNLTEAQRQFADAMQDYLSTVCAELNNEISRALYGVSIAKEKYYWPIRSSGVFSEMIRNQMQNPSNRQKNAGHMKATVRGANNAIELMGFMETWATHVNNTAMYNAFTLPMEDFMRVWNWRDTSGIGNRSMRQLILQKHGQAGVDYIDTFIKDLNKGVRGDPRESLLNSMLGKFKKGAVSASLSVAIQQPSAVGRALKYIDPKYFLGTRVEGVDGINATWEVMQQYAPVVGIKDIGRFDMDMGKSTIDILSGKNETGVMAAIDKLSGFLPEYMDKVTWVAMWEACKRQVKAQNPSLRGDALLTKAGELFTKTVTETQVYDSVFSRSGLMRSPSVAAKAVTAFMAEPTTTANMVYQAIQDFRHGDRTGAARSLASVGTAIVLNSLLASLVYASRDDDEEKTWLEKYLKSFTAEMIDGVNPLGYIPVVKDIFSVFQGYDVIRSDMSQWADLAKTLQKFTKAWKSYGEADEDDREARKEALKKAGIASTNLLASILNLGGIPLRNLLREIQGGVNIVKDIQRELPSDSRTKGYAIWEALNEYMPTIMRSDDGKSKQVYKAVTSGSAAWVNRLKSTYKNEDTFNRAVVTALVNNDSRIREAARAAVSGNSAERDRLAKEIVKEGHFTEEQVEAAIEKRIGQLPGASYDDMLDALRNGGDVKAAQAALAKYGYTQTQMENKVKSAAKEWYQVGVISAIDARKMLRDYGGMLTRDAQATVQKWTALLSTGTDFDEIQDEYLNGNLSRSRAVELYVKFGGRSQADAEAAVKKWDCEKDLGVRYDDLKDAYLGGDISADRVLSAMMKYGGVKEDSARATVEAYKWIRQHPKTELDVGQVKTYTKAIDTLGYSVEDAGISESVYLTFLEKASACTGEDRNGDGRTDSGSVRNQVVQVIDALPISGAQKDALYFAKGYAKRDLHKAPWH